MSSEPSPPDFRDGPVNPDAEPPAPEAAVSEGPPRLPRLPVPLPRMPKLNLVSTVILLVLTVLSMAFFPMILNLERYRHVVEEKASAAIGFPVRMKHLSLDFTRGLGVRAQSVTLLSTDGRRTLVRLGAITVAFDTGDLANRRFTPRSLKVDAPYLTLEQRDGDLYLRGLDKPLGGEGEAGFEELNLRLNSALDQMTLHSIEVGGGLVRLVTGPRGQPDIYTFRRIELDVSEPQRGGTLGLHLSSSVFRNNQLLGDADARVTALLPAEAVEIQSIPVSIELAVQSLNLVRLPPLRDAGIGSGTGRVSVSAAGHWNDIRGRIEFGLEDFTADFSSTFKERFTPGEVVGTFGFAWDGRFLKAESFGLQIGPTDLTYVRWLSDFKPLPVDSVHEMEVEFHVRDVDLEKEWNHIPWPVIGRQVSEYCNRQIRRSGHATYYRNFLPLRLTRNVDGSAEIWLDFDRFWIDTEIRDVEMFVLPENRLKFSGINGRFHISRGNFVFETIRGRVDDALNVEAKGGFDQIDRQARLHLDLSGEFPYPALLNILPNYGFRAVQKVVAPLSGGRGDLAGTATVDYDINKDVYSYSGELRLTGGNLHMANYPVALDGLSGLIRFTHDSLDLGPITGKFGTGTLSIRMSVSDPNGANPQFDLRVGGEDLALEQVLPSTSQMKGKGIISGNFTTSGRLGSSTNLKRTAFLRTRDVEIRTPEIRLPVRNLDCNLKYETGIRSSFSCGISYGESMGNVSAGFMESPQGLRGDFTIESPNANLDDILAAATGAREGVTSATRGKKASAISIIEPPLPDFGDIWKRGKFTGIVRIGRGLFRRVPFEEFTAQSTFGSGAIGFSTMTFSGPGGRYDFANLSIEPKETGDSRVIRMAPRLDGIWLKPMLESLGTPADMVDGTLSARGNLQFVLSDDGTDFCRSINGNLSMQLENGRISKDYRAFAQVASLVNLRLSAYPQGIPFKTLRADFDIGSGLAHGRGFVLDTADFDMKSDSVDVRLCDRWVKTNATVSVFRRELFSRLPVDLNRILRLPVTIDQSYADRTN